MQTPNGRGPPKSVCVPAVPSKRKALGQEEVLHRPQPLKVETLLKDKSNLAKLDVINTTSSTDVFTPPNMKRYQGSPAI